MGISTNSRYFCPRSHVPGTWYYLPAEAGTAFRTPVVQKYSDVDAEYFKERIIDGNKLSRIRRGTLFAVLFPELLDHSFIFARMRKRMIGALKLFW